MKVLERRIVLEGVTVPCSIGIHDHEREGPQTVLIDAVLELEAGAPVAEDAIGAVLDYDFFRQEVGALVASGHFNLQETLCEAIARLCLDKPGVTAVRVRTRKPDAYGGCATPGYEVYCRR